jgi:Tol biopolymer transport system component
MFGMPTPAPASSVVAFEPAAGQVLAPLGGQIVSQPPTGSQPRRVTQLTADIPALDVAAMPRAQSAVVVTVSPFEGSGTYGGDLWTLDLASGETTPLLARATADESLGAPSLAGDGSLIAFDRADKSVVAVAYRGQAEAHYPTRIDAVRADGSGRSTLVDDGHQPALSPSGTEVAFLRSMHDGTGLFTRSVAGGEEHMLLPTERFADLASPRYSPQGDRIAFVAAGPPRAGAAANSSSPLANLFGPAVALAHGISWDVWTIRPDGSDARRLAELHADDASVAWSPDGTQVFVYGATGSFLVNQTGEVAALGHVQGAGGVAWVLMP